MTIINGIEIDNICYKQNDIKYAIANNDPIEEKLNVIIVISNPNSSYNLRDISKEPCILEFFRCAGFCPSWPIDIASNACSS